MTAAPQVGSGLASRRAGSLGKWPGRIGPLAWLVAGTFYLFTLVRGGVVAPRFEGDTGVVIAGAAAARGCLERNQLRGCAGVQAFPLLQYLPALALLELGHDGATAFRVFSIASMAAFLGTLLLLWLGLRGRGVAPPLALALWLGTYSVWYFSSTFGEVVAGFLTLALVVACVWRRSAILIATLMALAGITKEFAPLFLLALGALVVLQRLTLPVRAHLRRERRMLVALLAGAGLSLAANIAFNVFRFDSPGNAYNLDPVLRVPNLAQHAVSFAGLWLSPNGGLLVFAPGLTLLVVAAALAAVQDVRAGRARWWQAAAAPGALFLLVALNAGLARWYSSFGWWAWGPRLTLPWLPVATYLALRFPSRARDRLVSAALGRIPAFAVTCTALCALALPHAAIAYAPEVYDRFFVANPECPSADVRASQAAFYSSINCMMFPRSELVLPPLYRLAWREDSRWACAAYLAMLAGLFGLARRHSRLEGGGEP